MGSRSPAIFLTLVITVAGHPVPREEKEVRKSKMYTVSSPKPDPQVMRSTTPSNVGRGSLGSARDASFSMSLASDIYKVDAANQIELSKILWEIRFLQSPEDMERQLQVIEAAMLAQVFLSFPCVETFRA